MNDLIIKIRALAVVLSARGTRPGHVGASTKCEAGKLRQELITLFNAEGDRHTTTEFFKTEVFEEDEKREERLIPDQDREPVTRFIPNAKGEILNVIIQHLVSAAFGNPSLSKDEREERILSAAKALPELCDKLESKPDTLVLAPVGANVWKQAREQNSKITISDQMQTLFIKDDSIVDRKNLSGVVAGILGCSDSAVRSRNNAAWKFYRTEQAKRKKLRKELKNKRSVDSEQNDADE